MSMYDDWDLVYGVTYQALNRKLARAFYQQRARKHKVKQLVALAIDPEKKGIRAGYTTHIARPGTYQVGKVPTVEVSFFDPQLQSQQYPETSSFATATLDNSGKLNAITPQRTELETLLYPPGIEVRRHPGDVNVGSTDNAVVLTGLAVNSSPLTPAGPTKLQLALADWLADDKPTGDRLLLSALNRYFTKRDATSEFNQAKLVVKEH